MRGSVKLAAVVAVAASISLGVQSSQAMTVTTYGFQNLTNNSEGGVLNPDVADQLFVDVEDWGSGQVAFKFYNNVGELSSITDVYFDDGTLFGIASIQDSDGVGTGVAFSQDASPGDLPGGGAADPDFETSAGFLADSDAGPGGVKSNGVDVDGEWLRIIFDLINGYSYTDVIAALALGGNNTPDLDGLRIGLRVQGLANGGSDSYLNVPTPVPLPAGLVLLLTGLAGMGAVGRSKAKRKEESTA